MSTDQQIMLQNKLTKAGVKSQFVFYPNEGHGWHGEALSDSFNKIETFLNENVQ